MIKRKKKLFVVTLMIVLVALCRCDKLSEEEKNRFKEAIINNDKKYIEYILSKKVDLNKEKEFGYLPLHIAASTNNIELIELFLKHGAHINSIDGLNQNCLFKTYDINTVKYLIEHGANVNQVDINGSIPLHNVAWHYELAKLYIDTGSDIFHKDKMGDTILFIAIMDNNYKLVKYLIDSKGVDVNEVNNAGFNGLIWYMVSRRKIQDDNIVKLLIQRGINVNHKDKDGYTALHFAIMLNRTIELIQLLLDNGADANIKNNKEQTPLDIAIEKGNKEIINLLKRYSRKQ